MGCLLCRSMGGVKYPGLNLIARKIWKWCEGRNLLIFASYVHSKDSFEADFESRRVSTDIEYKLYQAKFDLIVKKFGVPSIDLFASRINNKCKRFISWERDPNALTVDAFTVPIMGAGILLCILLSHFHSF